jgi:hypothetical protein
LEKVRKWSPINKRVRHKPVSPDRLEAYASMKPNLSRLAAKNVFFLFLVNFDRHLATTHIFGFGA